MVSFPPNVSIFKVCSRKHATCNDPRELSTFFSKIIIILQTCALFCKTLLLKKSAIFMNSSCLTHWNLWPLESLHLSQTSKPLKGLLERSAINGSRSYWFSRFRHKMAVLIFCKIIRSRFGTYVNVNCIISLVNTKCKMATGGGPLPSKRTKISSTDPSSPSEKVSRLPIVLSFHWVFENGLKQACAANLSNKLVWR